MQKRLNMSISDRLRQIRLNSGLSQSSFGENFGLAQTTYGPYETGKRSVPDEFKQQLADKYNINLHWLITGNGSMYNTSNSTPNNLVKTDNINIDIALKDSVEVPMLDLRLSAGHGSDWYAGSLTGEKLYIPKRVARRYPSNSVFAGATVEGDSMEPTLNDGEPVVFVKGFIKGDGIYVLAVNGELFVKRLEFNRILNVLRIISDNPKYPPTELKSDMQDSVRILGKVVIWVHGEA